MRWSFGDCWKLSAKLSFWFYQCLILLLLMLHDFISICSTVLLSYVNLISTVVGLAQLVECLTAEWEVTSSIPGVGPILRILKWLRNEGITFALLQMARPLGGSHAWPRKMVVVDVKIVSPVITFVLNTLTLKLSALLFFFFFLSLSQTTFAAVLLMLIHRHVVYTNNLMVMETPESLSTKLSLKLIVPLSCYILKWQ